MTQEERTMKIAEHEYGTTDRDMTKILQWQYYYYDGLMPIVERINTGDNPYAIGFDNVDVFISIPGGKWWGYPYDKDHPLIDALQDAILKYYELEEGSNNERG